MGFKMDRHEKNWRGEGAYLRAKGLVHLQNVGDVPGKPAEDFSPGEWTGWNWGYADQIESIRPVGEKSLAFKFVGYTEEKRFNRDRLIAIADSTWRKWKNPQKRNPSMDELADQTFEHFHGKPSEHITTDVIDWPPPNELEDEYGPFMPIPTDLALLGELMAICYEDPETLDDMVIDFVRPRPFLLSDYLMKSEGDESLYISGGGYSEGRNETCILGPILYVEYRTMKSFDDFEPTIYKHRFGEEFPILAQNKKGTQLYILRGESEFYLDRKSQVSAGICG